MAAKAIREWLKENALIDTQLEEVGEVVPKNSWVVIETSLFQQGAAKYLTTHELRALIRELVADPLSGRPVPALPGTFVLDWGKQSPLEILYLVGDQKLVLVEIQASTGTRKVVIEKGQEAAIGAAYDMLKRGMGWVTGRALWELFKKLFDWL